jgi:hypothetical protein
MICGGLVHKKERQIDRDRVEVLERAGWEKECEEGGTAATGPNCRRGL